MSETYDTKDVPSKATIFKGHRFRIPASMPPEEWTMSAFEDGDVVYCDLASGLQVIFDILYK